MSPEIEDSAAAWAAVFGDTEATARVLEELTQFAYALPETQIAGAAKVLLFLLVKRQQTRVLARQSRQPQKGRMT